MIKSFVFSGGKLAGEDVGLDFIKTMLVDEDAQIWLDIEAPTPEETRTILDKIFNFHPLAIEDCLAASEQPKIDEYERYLFMVIHALKYNASHEVEMDELNLFIGRNFLVTHHAIPLPGIRAAIDRVKKNAAATAKAADRLAYTVLDQLFDQYEPSIEALAGDIAELERQVLTTRTPDILGQVMELKQKVRRFRRFITPQREVITRITRGEFKLVRAHLLPYYRDLLDRLKRISDLAEYQRETLNSILQIHLNIQQMEVNRVIKILTILATLSLPLVIITGFYGMNFADMPELEWRYPYAWILTLALMMSGSIYWLMRKMHWL